MLKIKLSEPKIINKKYVVFLDSETRRTFKSKREATDYVTKIEGELNEALLFINEFYCIISTFYRTYFMADRDYRFKYDAENSLEFVRERLDYIASHTGSENFNAIISHTIASCFDSLEGATHLIEKKSRSRYDMLTRRRITLYNKLIKQYRNSFEEFKRQSIYEVKLIAKIA